MNPAYSRSGDRVAFTRLFFGADDDTAEIWVMNADGSNPQRLTSGHDDDQATWSPDDAWVAFIRSDTPSIAIVSATGGPVTTLVVEGADVVAWR